MTILKNLLVMFVIFTTIIFAACGGGGKGSNTHSPVAEDINGDGYPDLVIGASFYGYVESDPSSEGRVYIFFGSSSGLASSPSQIIESPLTGVDGFGKFIVLNDLNGDGYADMAVGNSGFSVSYNGYVCIYYGSSSGFSSLPETTIKGENLSNFGWSICSGNFNGDSFNDLAVGAPYGDGAVYVFYGSASHLSSCDLSSGGTADQTFAGTITNGTLGSSVTAGDFNGDGYDDLAALSGDGGCVDIYNGSGTGLPASYSSRRSSLASYTSPGSLAAGNVNGDSYEDLAVGAESYVSSTGRVYVFHGGSGGISAAADQELTGKYAADHFGHSLSIADANNDGYGDLAVGASQFTSGGTNQYWGAIYIYNGSSSGISATESAHLYGTSQSDYLGSIVHFIDVNADGNVDLYSLAEGYEYSTELFGRGYLYSGTASGISFASSWYFNAETAAP